ncbi:hypothetical protein OP10G_3440 [Fimbriimonas ginsengisoli Gsoil 348]|uniref:Uncharacterized protein n=1 Tax=Fimbriimonas ginsengisoli Gsoil 348 TaxID=661478 RepID=A0A068NTC8_FIMGI|nr:hypothetical protein OP10G_3440 [Fimbriimonas ginsengisoli Gsoil 348]
METMLPVSTKALMLPAPFAGKTPVSVSEYNERKTGRIVRVYRFSWAENFEGAVARIRKALSKEAGWKYDDSKPPAILDRKLAKGPVKYQALLLNPAKLVKSAKDPRGERIAASGWIWVSYNEERRPVKK